MIYILSIDDLIKYQKYAKYIFPIQYYDYDLINDRLF